MLEGSMHKDPQNYRSLSLTVTVCWSWMNAIDSVYFTVHCSGQLKGMIQFSGLSRFSGLFGGDWPSPLNRDTTVFSYCWMLNNLFKNYPWSGATFAHKNTGLQRDH